MIGQQMMAVLVAFLLIASTSCLIILASYFSALPVNKKNLVTRWAIKKILKDIVWPEMWAMSYIYIQIYFKIYPELFWYVLPANKENLMIRRWSSWRALLLLEDQAMKYPTLNVNSATSFPGKPSYWCTSWSGPSGFSLHLAYLLFTLAQMRTCWPRLALLFSTGKDNKIFMRHSEKICMRKECWMWMLNQFCW